MAPIPVSPSTTERSPLDATGREISVRALPSVEPAPGARADDSTTVRAPRPPRPPRPVADPDSEVPVPARRAAHALIVMALEVVDRKRAPQNTRGAFPPHLMEMLRTLARTGVPGQRLGPARVHRLHIHAAGPGMSDPSGDPGGDRVATGTDYEVCATYARGPRLFAVAARIRVTEKGAACTALRLV